VNANAVARNYGRLSPEERFRLILAASGRGDEAERDRLARAGERITLSTPDCAPYANAFDGLALTMFIDLLETAACYFDAFVWADDARDMEAFVSGEAEADGDEAGGGAEVEEEPISEEETDPKPIWERALDLALAYGFILRTRAEGWKLFCERLNILLFLLWEDCPGFDRLQRALALAEQAAFLPEGFLRWFNKVRPAGSAELAEVPLTAEGIADATDKWFREQVAWWGG
jgi:hypothetical protein